LGLCNLACSWCDTPYTWYWTGKNGIPQDKTALTHESPDDLFGRVEEMRVDRVVITGGEPLIQAKALEPLLTRFKEAHYAIEIETNGTRTATNLARLVTQWNVSPKLPNSGQSLAEAWDEASLRWFAGQFGTAFKIVCEGPDDVALAARLLSGLCPPWQVWIMPQTYRDNALSAELAEAVLHHGFNLTSRLQVAIWGERRGV